MARNPSPRCAGTLKDGSPCTHVATVGELCHVCATRRERLEQEALNATALAAAELNSHYPDELEDIADEIQHTSNTQASAPPKCAPRSPKTSPPATAGSSRISSTSQK